MVTITNGYCTLAEVKARLGIATADSGDDTILEQVATAVSRWIDSFTRRRFFTTATDETRYYMAQINTTLFLSDDVVSITSLMTDDDGDGDYEDTWATSDYSLQPANASLEGWPYSFITIRSFGNFRFPPGVVNGVKIVGKFGFNVVPAQIKEACLIQCGRIWKRKDAPFGVVGAGALGTVTMIGELDPDVRGMLEGFVRLVP